MKYCCELCARQAWRENCWGYYDIGFSKGSYFWLVVIHTFIIPKQHLSGSENMMKTWKPGWEKLSNAWIVCCQSSICFFQANFSMPFTGSDGWDSHCKSRCYKYVNRNTSSYFCWRIRKQCTVQCPIPNNEETWMCFSRNFFWCRDHKNPISK